MKRVTVLLDDAYDAKLQLVPEGDELLRTEFVLRFMEKSSINEVLHNGQQDE